MTLFATTQIASANSIVTITDSSNSNAFGGSLSGTLSTLVTAPSNFAFRGIAFAPVSASSPTITTSGTLSAVNTTYGSASASPTSSNLTGNLTVTPPSGFEVSTSISSGYSTSSITITASGTLASTTVYARLAATTTPGTYSGNIQVSGGGATAQNVATVSSTVATKALTVTGLTAQNKTYNGLTGATVIGTAVLSGVVGSDTVTLGGTASYT
ncbi:MAG: hypothetical protein EB072_19485, partial [Betaproteobacteria bacterium]|nr:hypothetical protein [Betaproteobacteria bacterium]